MNHNSALSIPVIFGCIDTKLTDEEKLFFSSKRPLGLILFAHNCKNPYQVRSLINEFREIVENDNAPILIDQEGGRVTRLLPPYWRHPPPANIFSLIFEQNEEEAKQAAYLNARLVGRELNKLNITVNCSPVLDLPIEGAHNVIGDRALGNNVHTIISLANSLTEGMLTEGIVPVMKHIPGHGRAKSDSHLELPIIDTCLSVLEKTDFVPFSKLRQLPWAMTAHVIYSAIDPNNPATISPKIINDIIRKNVGFKGVLISDDIGMEALAGNKGERAKAILQAGCDLVLECSGNLNDMVEVASAIPLINEKTLERLDQSEVLRKKNLKKSNSSSKEMLEKVNIIFAKHSISEF